MDLLDATEEVNFELSNVCNYGCEETDQKRCPLFVQKLEDRLPSDIVHRVLGYLGANGFMGRVAFHNYNEPLADPRLDGFIQEAKRRCPGCQVYILTNGVLLDQQRLNQLMEVGADMVEVSAYSDAIYDKVSDLEVTNSTKLHVVRLRGLDERLEVYDREPVNLDRPCGAPLRQLLVLCTGDIGLCCYDWNRRYTFGSLHKTDLESILYSADMWNLHRELKEGNRELAICRRCLGGK